MRSFIRKFFGLQGNLKRDSLERGAPQSRRPVFESLENRELLALSIPTEYQISTFPGADHTIYLDFGGETATYNITHNHATYKWNNGNPITTAPFDMDGNPHSFSTREWEAIRDITKIVGEYYASFKVNVTNVYSASTMNKIASGNGQRILVGGDGYWFGGGTGVAFNDTFSIPADIPAFAFSAEAAKGTNDVQRITLIAATVTHETGHTLGLNHDGCSGHGVGHGEYCFGIDLGSSLADGRWIPIMGGCYYVSSTDFYRQLYQWNDGSYSGATNKEDDLAILSRVLAYNNDDYTTITPLMPNGDTLNVTGKIERNTDADTFSFIVGTESTVTVTVAAGVNVNGTQVSSLLHRTTIAGASIIPNTQTASIASLTTVQTLTLSAGTYTVTVAGAAVSVAGDSKYGSLGSYDITIHGVKELETPPVAPNNLRGTDKTPDSITLVWDAAENVSGYEIQYRQSDTEEWMLIFDIMETMRTVPGLAQGTLYEFQVLASSAVGKSDWSESVFVTTSNLNPVAIIDTADSLSVQEGCWLAVFGSGVDPLGLGLTYLWDLTDTGEFVEYPDNTAWFNAEHLNGFYGSYHWIRLKVRDAEGNESPIVTANVTVLNVTPTYTINGPQAEELVAGQVTSWEFSAADPIDAIMNWAIDWGDGTITNINGGPRSRIAESHLYRQAGDYTVKIQTTDFDWIESIATFDIFVAESQQEVQQALEELLSVEERLDFLPETLVFRIDHELPRETVTIFNFPGELAEIMRLRQMLDLDQSRKVQRTPPLVTDFVWNDEDVFDLDWIDFMQEQSSAQRDSLFEKEVAVHAFSF